MIQPPLSIMVNANPAENYKAGEKTAGKRPRRGGRETNADAGFGGGLGSMCGGPGFLQKLINAFKKWLEDMKRKAREAADKEKKRLEKEKQQAKDLRDKLDREQKEREKNKERQAMDDEKKRLADAQNKSNEERKDINSERDKQQNFNNWLGDQDKDLRNQEQNLRDGGDTYCKSPPCQSVQDARSSLSDLRVQSIQAGNALDKRGQDWTNNQRDLNNQWQNYQNALWQGVGMSTSERNTYRASVTQAGNASTLEAQHTDLKTRQAAAEAGNGPPLNSQEKAQLDRFNQAADIHDLQTRQSTSDSGKGPPLTADEKTRLNNFVSGSIAGDLQVRQNASERGEGPPLSPSEKSTLDQYNNLKQAQENGVPLDKGQQSLFDKMSANPQAAALQSSDYGSMRDQANAKYGSIPFFQFQNMTTAELKDGVAKLDAHINRIDTLIATVGMSGVAIGQVLPSDNKLVDAENKGQADISARQSNLDNLKQIGNGLDADRKNAAQAVSDAKAAGASYNDVQKLQQNLNDIDMQRYNNQLDRAIAQNGLQDAKQANFIPSVIASGDRMQTEVSQFNNQMSDFRDAVVKAGGGMIVQNRLDFNNVQALAKLDPLGGVGDDETDLGARH